MQIKRNTFIRWIVLVGIFVFGLSCSHGKRPVNRIPAEKVWKHVQKYATRAGLDPHFVYAICNAESSLDANAQTHVARGMMQLTEPAWQDATRKSYSRAFDWETNVETGILYLAKVKEMLIKERVFSYARLSACYLYGFDRLRKERFYVGKMPRPENLIYQKLFDGNVAPVKVP